MPPSNVFSAATTTLFSRLPKTKQWFTASKWQYVYYALAIFNLLTVGGSLYLNHRMMATYTQSIELNRQWAVRLETISGLGQLLAAVNAPGNDVFDSHNVQAEALRLELAHNKVQQQINVIQHELQTEIEPAVAAPLLKDLAALEVATEGMVAEARRIFAYFSQNQPEMAGRRMATMDRQYHQVGATLATLRNKVSLIQQELLAEQETTANVFRWYGFAIAGALLLMVAGVTFYGQKLAQKMKSNAQAKERSIAELQRTEARLKEQTQQLQLTLEDLQKTQLQLVQSEKMSSLGELVAGVAHEINNPVNFIHGNLIHVHNYSHDLLNFIRLYQQHYPQPAPTIQAAADDMDLEFLQEDLVKLLDSMKLGTDRIRQIVLSLRNFSRMDEADFKAVNIHEGIDSTLLILHHRLKAKPNAPAIAVIKDYADLPLVECYAGQLNQVFMNVLSNAIDALEESGAGQLAANGEPQITIHTSMLGKNWVEIAIADNGVGMPDTIKHRIFDPFFTTKPVGRGTGLGMSISYQIIVEKHGGNLKCASAPNQGTQFLIQIPIQH